MAEYVTKLQQFKLDAIDELKQDFQSARDYILADYRGLNVAQITDLRNKLRENGALGAKLTGGGGGGSIIAISDGESERIVAAIRAAGYQALPIRIGADLSGA